MPPDPPSTETTMPGPEAAELTSSGEHSPWQLRPHLLTSIRDPALLRRQLKWLVAIRLVVVSSVGLAYFLATLLPEEAVPIVNTKILFLLGALTYGATLVYIALLQVVAGREALHAYLQFAGDLLLISALVYYFGGVTSPFSMLYLVVISIAAVLLRRGAAVLVANVAYLLYASILLSFFFGWIQPPSDLVQEAPSLWRLVYNLATHLFGFYAVALLTSYLARNVTLAERELEEKREDLADLQLVYRDVVQSIASGLATTDLEGHLTSINRLGEQLIGRRSSELLGLHVTEVGLISADSWPLQSSLCQYGDRVREQTTISVAGRSEPVRLGYTLTLLSNAHGDSVGFIIVFQDLTEWHKLQEELRMKDRMAAVGELAAGIAHEIGNPLAAISGSVQMLGPDSEPDPGRSKLLEIVLRESRRLDRTIKSFLQFARPKERSNVPFDIARLIAEHVELLSNSEEVHDGHRVEVTLDPPSAVVMADPDQISQIFWNLTRNALRAMPDGGCLELVGEQHQGVYRLQVRDTGCGMSKEERANLFHPFQSFFDKGTGIGMAIVYRIVEEHGGRVFVDSEPGAGTTIIVELPIADVAAGVGGAA